MTTAREDLLAAGLAVLEYKTLLIDSDPQANATSGVGFDPRNVKLSIYECIISDANPKPNFILFAFLIFSINIIILFQYYFLSAVASAEVDSCFFSEVSSFFSCGNFSLQVKRM